MRVQVRERGYWELFIVACVDAVHGREGGGGEKWGGSMGQMREKQELGA